MKEQIEPSLAELIGRIDSALAEEDDELVALRHQNATLKAVEADFKAVEAERDEALREAKLTLAQLHEAQQELQHYFLLCQQQAQILKAAEALQARSFALLAKGNK
ncbi:hypothetical protein OA163_00675 [bacterium]|nr:hypothetical protein [bacterium]